MKHQYKPLSLLCFMFFMVGSMFCMNDILFPAIKTHFNLSYTQTTYIQLSFYTTYILFPVPIAWMIHRYGYRISLIVSLLICAVGCALFLPSRIIDSYLFVIASLFIISTGLTVVNVAANPYATLLGDPAGAHMRINLVQTFSRVGYAVAPMASYLIYSKTGEIRFHLPYVVLSVCILAVTALFYFSNIPSMKAEEEEKFSTIEIFKGSVKYKHLLFGVVAMFFYVGAEACTCGFFISYLKSVAGMAETTASKYMTLYYIFAAVMNFLGVLLLRKFKAHKLVGVFGIGMIAFYLVCIFLNTGYNEFFLAGLGIFISIMFPTLFSLAIEDVGDFAGKGSALLNFAIVGGSVFPFIQGMVADRFGVSFSYLVPTFCFVLITIYAFYFTKDSFDKRARLLAQKV